MALFQIYRGSESTLDQVPLHEGYAYFCVDTGRLWIDIANNGSLEENRLSVEGSSASGFVIDGEFVPADQFVQIGDISEAGLLIGDGEGAVEGIVIPNSAIVVGTSNGVKGVVVPDKGLLVGNATNGIEGVEIDNNALLVGDSENGVRGVTVGNYQVLTTTGSGNIGGPTVSGAGALFALSAGMPSWGTLPVGVGGTGRTSLTLNAVLTGNNTGAVNSVQTTSGALYATGNNAPPQFGTLPIAQGGTGATSVAAARATLNVYSRDDTYTRSQVDQAIEASADKLTENIEAATASVYNDIVLEAANWEEVTEEDSETVYYTYTHSIETLRCGKNGDIPPIINCLSNKDEYNNIYDAEATAGVGIVFKSSVQPENDITVMIIDNA